MQHKNLNILIENALAVEAKEAKEAGTLGFMGRALVQATMPHRKSIKNEFIRENGSFKLIMLAPSAIGLPYGSIPRLLTAWLTTEAVRTKQRELILGNSLSHFMSQLELTPTGGRWGNITRLKNQMCRLFSSSISCVYEDSQHKDGINMQVAEEYHLWWEPKKPEQSSLWESTITLNKKFFEEITDNPVPLDMRVLKAIKRSPMALDIYCWLTYRMSYLRQKTEIPWVALQSQFGSEYASNSQGTRDFKRAFLRELKKVQLLYNHANAESGNTGLLLKPSKPHVTKSNNLVE